MPDACPNTAATACREGHIFSPWRWPIGAAIFSCVRSPPCAQPLSGRDCFIRSKSMRGSCCLSIRMRSGHYPTAMPDIPCGGRSSSGGSLRRSRLAKLARSPAPPRESAGFGNADFGSIRCVIPTILPGTSITCISIRSNTGLSRGQPIGRIPRSGERSGGDIIRRIGRKQIMMLADLERSRLSRNDRTASRCDGGVRKSTPPYACCGRHEPGLLFKSLRGWTDRIACRRLRADSLHASVGWVKPILRLPNRGGSCWRTGPRTWRGALRWGRLI